MVLVYFRKIPQTKVYWRCCPWSAASLLFTLAKADLGMRSFSTREPSGLLVGAGTPNGSSGQLGRSESPLMYQVEHRRAWTSRVLTSFSRRLLVVRAVSAIVRRARAVLQPGPAGPHQQLAVRDQSSVLRFAHALCAAIEKAHARCVGAEEVYHPSSIRAALQPADFNSGQPARVALCNSRCSFPRSVSASRWKCHCSLATIVLLLELECATLMQRQFAESASRRNS